MNHLIEEFLGQNNYCPLPGIGTLKLKDIPAHIHLGENRISAPSAAISLLPEEINSNDFIDFVSSRQQTAPSTAQTLLSEFCSSIKNLNASDEIILERTGSFFKDEAGNVQFRQKDLPSVFLPEIALKKVIHTDAVHQVRVGDTETTTKRMNKYLHESKKVSVNKGGIVLMIIALFVIAAVVFYVSNPGKKIINLEDFNFYKTTTEKGKQTGHPKK